MFPENQDMSCQLKSQSEMLKTYTTEMFIFVTGSLPGSFSVNSTTVKLRFDSDGEFTVKVFVACENSDLSLVRSSNKVPGGMTGSKTNKFVARQFVNTHF